MKTMETPLRLKIRAEMDRAAAEGRWQRHAELQKQWTDLMLGRATLDSLEARLDAARRKVSPGQLGLDFNAPATATSGTTGPGGGEKCGKGWIDPNKTCRKGASDEPINTKEPFSRQVMERLVAGIEQRSFSVLASRHDGTDLALALEKLAYAPGLVGEHAREAMAFMEEVQAKVMIMPTRDFAPSLDVDESVPAPRWDDGLSAAENVEALRSYGLTRLNAAARGRAYAKRTGLWSNDMLNALKKDKSPKGQAIATVISQARDGTNLKGRPEPAYRAYDQKEKELREALVRYEKAAGTDDEQPALQNVRNLFQDVRNYTYVGGPDERLDHVRRALNLTLSDPKTGGHYWPGGNTYWKVSMAGKNGSRLDPEEISVTGMSALASNTINVQDRRREFTFSSTQGLKESEKALITHIHELGHMVHDTSFRTVSKAPGDGAAQVAFAPNAMTRGPAIAQEIQRNGAGPTRYANQNLAEMFAESFVGYVIAPDALKDKNPELYDWVEGTMKKARSNAVASRDATNWYWE